MKNIFEELKSRGFIQQTNNDEKIKKLLEKSTTIYAGFDPSAPSLHIGSLTLLKAISLFQKYGHKVIFLVGGATGLVGDPTGKEKSRKRLAENQVRENAKKIKEQVENMGILKFSGKNPAIFVNNYDWQSKFKFIDDFLTKIAPGFSINYLIKLETFAKRIKEQQNLSLMEFMYPVLQAWDFLHLYKKYGCSLQIGGNDQWANILEGVTLIRRNENKEVFAIAIPLLTTADGKKMGKTESGTIWLEGSMTPPFQLFQELGKTPDDLVEKMFKLLTDLDLGEIKKIMRSNPRDRQKRLAFEIAKVIHGEDEAKKAQKDSIYLYIKRNPGRAVSIPTLKLQEKGLALIEILAKGSKISKSEIRRRCESGAVSISDKKISDPQIIIKTPCTIKFGKNDFLRVRMS